MTPLSARDIADAVQRMHARIGAIRDTLDAADRTLGDGDTGMTVANVVSAWTTVLAAPFDDVGALLRDLGRATRRSSGSSLGSVLAIGLTAAARTAGTSVDRDALAGMLTSAIDAIVERSGAAPGDKTILDSLIAVRDAVASDDDAVEAARRALDAFRPREARIGRARMYGAKSIGHDDPGMLAACLLLEATR